MVKKHVLERKDSKSHFLRKYYKKTTPIKGVVFFCYTLIYYVHINKERKKNYSGGCKRSAVKLSV